MKICFWFFKLYDRYKWWLHNLFVYLKNTSIAIFEWLTYISKLLWVYENFWRYFSDSCYLLRYRVAIERIIAKIFLVWFCFKKKFRCIIIYILRKNSEKTLDAHLMKISKQNKICRYKFYKHLALFEQLLTYFWKS